VALGCRIPELNITSTFDVGFWDPIHLVFLADYVKNVGFNRSDVAMLTEILTSRHQRTVSVGLSVGHPIMRQKGDWKVYGYYRYLQADAVMDAYTDDNFHLGGTNARGWILGATWFRKEPMAFCKIYNSQ